MNNELMKEAARRYELALHRQRLEWLGSDRAKVARLMGQWRSFICKQLRGPRPTGYDAGFLDSGASWHDALSDVLRGVPWAVKRAEHWPEEAG